MRTFDFGLELKELSDEGVISGYGAIFNNVDQVGDRLVPGAFGESLAKHTKSGTRPMMLWNHDPYQPIGVWTDIAEDSKGLKVSGKLVLESPKGREVHALMKAEAISALSIGYQTISDSIEGNVRLLKKVDLWEISPVSFPANGKARITSVKSSAALDDFARRLRDGEPPSTKEFEDILREAGVPKALATQIASVGYAKAIRSESEGKANDRAMSILRDAAIAFTSRT